jgi:hypothetical protein
VKVLAAALLLSIALPAAGQGQMLDRRAYFPPCERGELERGWIWQGRAVGVERVELGECVRVNGAAARRTLYSRCCDGEECSPWSGPAVDGEGGDGCS